MISVIILNWNGKNHLHECLSSVLSQTYKDYEVIVVDNGSTDGSQEYIKTSFSSVGLICNGENFGFCKGNNIGIRASKGEYIVLLNNDTVVEPDWLQQLYECMISDPEVGFCASRLLLYSERDLLDAAGDGYSICGAGYKRGHLEEAVKYDRDEFVFGACAGAAMYKREMLDKIGLLDEDFFVAYEDSDLSFRAQLAGYKCKYASKAIVYHKVNSTLGTLSDTYVFYGHRNVEYAYFKNMPSKLIFRTIFRHIAYGLLAFAYFIRRGKGKAFVKAKLDFLRNIKLVKEKRKSIQAMKCVDDAYIWAIMEKRWLSTRIKGK
jgi:GT2 family glycosyltransferase